MIDGHGPTRRRAPAGGSRCRLPLMCCKRARPHKGRPTSLIRDIRDRASGGNQSNETSHPYPWARPSEPNSPPTEPAGLLMQPETASAINTGGPLHEPAGGSATTAGGAADRPRGPGGRGPPAERRGPSRDGVAVAPRRRGRPERARPGRRRPPARRRRRQPGPAAARRGPCSAVLRRWPFRRCRSPPSRAADRPQSTFDSTRSPCTSRAACSVATSCHSARKSSSDACARLSTASSMSKATPETASWTRIPTPLSRLPTARTRGVRTPAARASNAIAASCSTRCPGAVNGGAARIHRASR